MQKKLWNRDFILLLQGNAVSTIGDLMYSVAIGYWVYEKTGSSGLMGIMSAISLFVSMFLSPFCGSIVDKLNRKWVLVAMDLMQGGVMLGVGILAFLDSLSVPVVLVAAFLAAFGSVFYSPAASTLMLDIIPHDDMVRGQSVFSGANSMINMLGSAFSGAMVAFLGVPFIVVFNGLSNIYSAVTELFVRVPKTLRQGQQVTLKSVAEDSKSAVRTIFSDPCLRIFVLSALLLNLLGAGPLSLLLPFTIEKGFSLESYGVLMFLWTGASLASVVLLGAVKLSPKARFWVMAVGFIASCVFLVGAYLSKHFLLTCILAVLASFTNCAGNTVLNASMMLALPEENRGAILGFVQSACIGGTALSTVAYGFLGDVFSLHLVFTAGTVLSLLPMVCFCFHKKVKAFVLSH